MLERPDQFQARADQHEAIEAAAAAGRAAVLSGPPGTGKSHLAASHARELMESGDLDLVVWTSADDRGGIVSQYALAAQHAGLGITSDPQAAATQFLGWLTTTEIRWMIVLDNVESVVALADLWPVARPGVGRVVATTVRQDGSLFNGRDKVTFEVFTPAQARDYLQKRVPADLADDPDGIAQDLEYLPLALSHASAYLIDQDMPCSQYRRLFADKARSLDELFPRSDELFDGSIRTVAATMAVAIERADEADPVGAAGTLLELASLLDPNGIPLGVFTTHAAQEYFRLHMSSVADEPLEELIRRGLGNLHRFNVATRSDGVLQLHGLVQRTVQTTLLTGQAAVHAAVVGAAEAVLQIWPDVERDQVDSARLRANASTLANGPYEFELWNKDDGPHLLLFRSITSLRRAGLVAEALGAATGLHATATDRLGSDHLSTCVARDHLARVVGEAGDPAKAVAAFEGLLTDRLRLLGADHPDTLLTRSRLAYWRARTGDLTAAIAAYDELMAELLNRLDPDHVAILTIRSNLASWQSELGDLSSATSAFEDLLADRLRVLGPDHPDCLATRANLAANHGNAGDPVGAAAAYQELLTDYDRVLGPDHPNTLLTRNNLAHWLGEAGDTDGAADTFQSLLSDCLRILGPDHPDTLRARANLAAWASGASNPSEAAELYESVVSDQLRILGPNHPDTLSARGNIAFWRARAGDVAKASAVYETLLVDQERILGADHPDTLTTRNGMAYLRGANGDPAGAVAAYHDVVSDYLRILGPNHPDTLKIRANFAYWRSEAGSPANAIAELEGLLTELVRRVGPDHLQVFTTRSNLARCRGKAGDRTGAISTYDSLLTDQVRVLGADHPDTLTTRGNLAHWRGEDGDVDGAVAAFEILLADRVRILSNDHPDTAATRDQLDVWRAARPRTTRRRWRPFKAGS
ncbi:tetratricopeptide repeat protein [Kribbella sp. CA-253562]|uniref:tetratricopeptide repeat protein n=1 Tax=Kribbella sp. CA-253562 TaxID=3239942 RepID=UPI003D90258A